MMQRQKTVDDYINKHALWTAALTELREILRATPLQETMKWGSPVYTLEGKNVIGLGAFRSHVALWFFQGALLRDTQQKLINAQENKTRAMRQWRFDSVDEIREDAETVKAYVQEAIANQRQGKAIKPERNKALEIPAELAAHLSQSTELEEQFERLSKSKRREYAEYIAEAKREETRQKRLQKITPMILSGIGLHDKYRK